MAMSNSQQPSNARGRRGAWWLISRGAALFAAGFGLSFVGSWAGLYWLQVVAFALAPIAMVMLIAGFALSYKAYLGGYWRWFVRESEQNERDLRARDAERERNERNAVTRDAGTID